MPRKPNVSPWRLIQSGERRSGPQKGQPICTPAADLHSCKQPSRERERSIFDRDTWIACDDKKCRSFTEATNYALKHKMEDRCKPLSYLWLSPSCRTGPTTARPCSSLQSSFRRSLEGLALGVCNFCCCCLPL